MLGAPKPQGSYPSRVVHVSAPTSTYRLQIRPSLTLSDAAALLDYLHELGADAVYLSPILTATSGSDHGYDCTDPTSIDPERGGEEGWRMLVQAAAKAGMKLVVDIVPNHVGIEKPAENPAWWSVLAQGRDSAYADWFDIDWSRAPILVPILGADAGTEDLQIVRGVDPSGHQSWELRYFEHRFPIAEGTYTEGDPIDEVLARQHYRLAHWRTGDRELNYRRFFAVTTLAGVRQEDPRVFEATHRRILEWVREDRVTGLRVDHPDGLVDPGGYLTTLREHIGDDVWLTAEKILEPGEELPGWPIQGTTGYDAMAEVNGIFIDPSAEAAFTTTYQEFTGDTRDLAAHVLAGKTMVVQNLFVAELARIAALVPELPPNRVGQCLGAIAAHMDVYRSYLPFGRDHLTAAAGAAAAEFPDLAPMIDGLLRQLADPVSELARRFQQLTGAVMAKGVEDTAYYRYNRFVALNEVGGDPAHFGYTPDQFHAALTRRQQTWPRSMTSLSTHDTKRGEDVRARLAVLSETPEPFGWWVAEFAQHTDIPSAPLANLLAQVLVGAGPIERERMHAYAEKAMREACDGTSWNDPQQEFEAAVHAAVDAAYDDDGLNDSLERMWVQIEQPGWSNSLGQKLIQLTMPGIPDVYQGTELWENSLVDPDNRRPVDFAARRDLLALSEPPFVDETGQAKFWVVRKALRLRRERPELFTDYTPVYAEGPEADHFIGFDRGGAITCVTRLPYTLGEDGGWGETVLRLEGSWRDELTGSVHSGAVSVTELFDHYPVALLVKE